VQQRILSSSDVIVFRVAHKRSRCDWLPTAFKQPSLFAFIVAMEHWLSNSYAVHRLALFPVILVTPNYPKPPHFRHTPVL